MGRVSSLCLVGEAQPGVCEGRTRLVPRRAIRLRGAVRRLSMTSAFGDRGGGGDVVVGRSLALSRTEPADGRSGGRPGTARRSRHEHQEDAARPSSPIPRVDDLRRRRGVTTQHHHSSARVRVRHQQVRRPSPNRRQAVAASKPAVRASPAFRRWPVVCRSTREMSAPASSGRSISPMPVPCCSSGQLHHRRQRCVWLASLVSSGLGACSSRLISAVHLHTGSKVRRDAVGG